MSYLRARLEIRFGLHMNTKIWGCQVTTRWAEIGVRKMGFFGIPKNEPKLKVSPSIFLNDGLETGLNARCGLQWDSHVGLHILSS